MTLFIFLAVLVVLILVHELGHFIVAKKSDIRVDEFGIGFPPKIVGKKYGETEYSINLLPIGGFVRIWGEDPTEEHADDSPENKRSFVKKPLYIQALVLIAGVTMNVFLAFVLFTVANLIGIPTAAESTDEAKYLENPRLLVSTVMSESPAEALLRPADEIYGMRGENSVFTAERPYAPTAVSDFISQTDGPITFEVIRKNEKVSFTIEPEKGILPENPDVRAVGFSMMLVGTEAFPLHIAIIEGAKRTFVSFADVSVGLYTFLGGIFTGKSDFSQISGPVGIVGLVGDAAALGFVWLLVFSAVISLNLAVINLLPFPALDGGRLVFVAIEAVTGRPIKPIIATRVNQFGFIALLALMLIVTFQDVLKIFRF